MQEHTELISAGNICPTLCKDLLMLPPQTPHHWIKVAPQPTAVYIKMYLSHYVMHCILHNFLHYTRLTKINNNVMLHPILISKDIIMVRAQC